MPECQNCGSHITPDFARVLGSNDDEALACLKCTTGTAVKSGAAAIEDRDSRSHLRGEYA